MVSYIRETHNNDMMDSSGLKAKRALHPESTMYFIATLSAVILMNSNFQKKNYGANNSVATTVMVPMLTVPNFSVRSLVSNVPRGWTLGFIASLPR